MRASTASESKPAFPRHLRCLGCDQTYPVEMLVHCPSCGPGAFLRTEYPETESNGVPLDGDAGVFQSYRQWLPFDFCRELPPLQLGCVPAPEIAAELGLGDVWLAVSGYAPELGASLPTCTFKTLEAVGVMSRVLSSSEATLIMSSAGNAGVGVLEFGSRWNEPAVVIIPESAAHFMVTCTEPSDRSPILICLKGATYLDAIQMVGAMVEEFGERVVREGGAFNVARRDSMGVPVLRASQAIGKIPDHYFQAVGSGTGGIAAHEAATRLAKAGVSGGPMRLHLAQNKPFTPMAEAYQSGADRVEEIPRDEVLQRVAQTFTSMLANAKPPYHVRGGVKDVLDATGGAMYAVSNDEARDGVARVHGHHGVVAAPEGGAAMAALVQAAEAGRIGAGETVLVHLTGGGYQRSLSELGKKRYPVTATPDALDYAAVSAVIRDYLHRIGG